MAKMQTGKVEGTVTRRNRLVKIELDEVVIPRRSAEAEHERAIAIYDILEENQFDLIGQTGPFHLYLRAEGRHIRFDICNENDLASASFSWRWGRCGG